MDEDYVDCDGIIISEIFSYYIESQSEQFIELYNPTDEEIKIDYCSIRFKGKNYSLSGEIAPKTYLDYRNEKLVLTKNPTSSLEIEIMNINGDTIDVAEYEHGQRKGVSLALFDDEWRFTYNPTPGTENIFQEFQTCPAGKIINEQTGNCINETTEESVVCPEGKYLNPLTGRCKTIPSESVKICKDGYYLNPLTNRCRKIPEDSSEVTECKEGYERNPETNRCRKIRIDSEMDYAPEVSNEETFSNPKVFIATVVIVLVIAVAMIILVYQYRHELKKFFKRVIMRKKL